MNICNCENYKEKKEPIPVTQAITAINNIRLDAGQENSLSIEDSLCIIEQELKAKDDNIARKENDILMMVNVNNEQKKEIKQLKENLTISGFNKTVKAKDKEIEDVILYTQRLKD